MDRSKLFYVLNGLLNGERGVSAETTSGRQLADGHYFLLGDDVDGVGPFVSQQDAWDAGQKAERTQTWAFPTDDGEPVRLENDDVYPDECNVATIEEVFNGNQSEYFECSLEGSYETLTLRVSCGSFEAAADVYRQLLKASHKYQ